MGLLSWIFYGIMGVLFFIIIGFLDKKYELSKIQKLIISIILLMIVSGICFRWAINYTDNIFLIFVFLMIVDIIYNTYFIERDFFDKKEANIEYYILVIIVGFFVNQEFINSVSQVFLTGEDLRIVLWFLSFVFVYSFMKEKNILVRDSSITDNRFMSSQSVLVSFAKLKHRFYDDCNFENKDLENIVYSIMILENSRRSKMLRNYDYFMFRLNGNKKKLGIMQVESKKFITDSESIELTAKNLEKLINKNKSSKVKMQPEKIIDSYCGNDAAYVKYIFDIVKKF